jgi:hypothetical protein
VAAFASGSQKIEGFLKYCVSRYARSYSSCGEDYPEIDFQGTLNFNITGLLLYMKMFF